MHTAFLLVAGITLVAATAAMCLRNLVHCVLCAVVAFTGLGAAFLLLNAEFLGFAQVLVYVGAVSILVVIALLLTRNVSGLGEKRAFQPWGIGVGIALLTLGGIVSALLAWPGASASLPAVPNASVSLLGQMLMTRYVVALEVLGLLLTAALVGAALLAGREPHADPTAPEGGGPC